MRGWIVLGVVLLVLALIGLLPLGADAAYEPEGGFALGIRLGRFTIRLGGGEKRKKKDRPAKKKKDEGAGEKKKRSLPPLPVVKMLLGNGYALLCRLVSRLHVDILRLHFVAASADPYNTAMAYAAAGTAMDGLLRVANGRISRPDLMAGVDFDRSEPVIDARLCLTIRVYQLLGAVFAFGGGMLRDYITYKKEQ